MLWGHRSKSRSQAGKGFQVTLCGLEGRHYLLSRDMGLINMIVVCPMSVAQSKDSPYELPLGRRRPFQTPGKVDAKAFLGGSMFPLEVSKGLALAELCSKP